MRGERLEKAKRVANKTFKHYHGFSPRNGNQINEPGYFRFTEEEIQHTAGIYRKTKVPCSCWMCGNPRKFFGYLTRNEIIQHTDAENQYDELGIGYRPKPKKIW